MQCTPPPDPLAGLKAAIKGMLTLFMDDHGLLDAKLMVDGWTGHQLLVFEVETDVVHDSLLVTLKVKPPLPVERINIDLSVIEAKITEELLTHHSRAIFDVLFSPST